jgi:hypothetical protein
VQFALVEEVVERCWTQSTRGRTFSRGMRRPGCKPGHWQTHMSPIAEFDQRLEQMIRDFAMRILAPRYTEFDAVWETANRICDRYELGKKALTVDKSA